MKSLVLLLATASSAVAGAPVGEGDPCVSEAYALALHQSTSSRPQLRSHAYLGNFAVIMEYDDVYDVHTTPDPSLPLRAQAGGFDTSVILEDLAPLVDPTTFDFVLLFSVQELPGWLNSGARIRAPAARNIGFQNDLVGAADASAVWPRLRSVPHMNSIEFLETALPFEANYGALVAIHEISHNWGVFWNPLSIGGPSAWTPDLPIAWLATGTAHWAFNFVDSEVGPENPPGIMYSGPTSRTLNQFDLYAMGLMTYEEIEGVSYEVFECVPTTNNPCSLGAVHEIRISDLVDGLRVAGPEYHTGDGRRNPPSDPEMESVRALIVVVRGQTESLGAEDVALIREMAEALPSAWAIATRAQSQLSVDVVPGLVFRSGFE